MVSIVYFVIDHIYLNIRCIKTINGQLIPEIVTTYVQNFSSVPLLFQSSDSEHVWMSSEKSQSQI